MIKFFKLMTGDELMGHLIDEDDYDLRRLDNPVRLLLTREGYKIVRLPIRSLVIDKEHILYEGESDPTIIRDYVNYVEAIKREAAADECGLVLPERNLVVG